MSSTHNSNSQRKPTSKHPDDIVIVSALRTPLCRSRKGGLAKVPPSTLLTAVLQATIEQRQNSGNGGSSSDQRRQAFLQGSDINDICLGNCLMPPSGFAAMRMAAVAAGIPAETTSLSWVNRQCSSGLQAVANIAHSISMGEINIGVGGGVESMSFYPMNSIKAPDVDWTVMKDKRNRSAMDCLIPMGITSDNVVAKYGLERTDLDRFAMESHHKAARAQRDGKFDKEIVPVEGITQDDGIRPQTSMEILGKLKPVFSEDGKTTAGNSSQTTDGAAACLLMKRSEAQRRGLDILGVWRGYSVQAVPPKIMGIGPAVAIPHVLKLVDLTLSDVDVFEINEAFASQASWCVNVLGIPLDKVNPNGGAIALGHPLGCTGARQIATLLQELHRTQKRYGVVSMCIGTGMGAAAVLEVEPPESRL